jgi:hypothetical protein
VGLGSSDPVATKEDVRMLAFQIRKLNVGLKQHGTDRDQQLHKINELEQQLDQLRKTNLYLQVGFYKWTPKWNAQQVAMRFLLINFLGIIAGACLIGFDALQELGFGLVVGGFFGASTLLTAVWNQLYENERELFTSTESDQRASELDSLISQSKKLVAEQQALVDKQRTSTTNALNLRALLTKWR